MAEIVIRPDGTETDKRSAGKLYRGLPSRDGVPVVAEMTAAEKSAIEADAKADVDRKAADLAARKYTLPKILIIRRLDAAGILETAHDALRANKRLDALWEAAGAIKANDPDVNAFLTSIGADLGVILAPPE